MTSSLGVHRERSRCASPCAWAIRRARPGGGSSTGDGTMTQSGAGFEPVARATDQSNPACRGCLCPVRGRGIDVGHVPQTGATPAVLCWRGPLATGHLRRLFRSGWGGDQCLAPMSAHNRGGRGTCPGSGSTREFLDSRNAGCTDLGSYGNVRGFIVDLFLAGISMIVASSKKCLSRQGRHVGLSNG